MKKRIIFISMLLLFTTGCTCEYNLTIKNDIYQEEISIMGDTAEEVAEFNKKWEIPTDKEEYGIGLDPSSQVEFSSDLYKYTLTGNTLKFSHDFDREGYQNSSAVSNCYDMLNVIEYGKNILISSSSRAKCFDQNVNIDNIRVNITVDRPVTNNNADYINGDTYTWIISKNNASTKSINMSLDNSTTEDDSSNIDPGTTTTTKASITPNNSGRDYTMYIFYAMLLTIFLIAFFIFNKMKNKGNKMDD